MEETTTKPKPMVEIGGRPILWHIMKYYSFYGLTDFIICCGYKGYKIKEYFANYYLHMSDVTFDLKNNTMKVHHARAEPWNVTLVDTGDTTMTGGRLKRVRHLLGNSDFCMTYGDGLTILTLIRLLNFIAQISVLLHLQQSILRLGLVHLSKLVTMWSNSLKNQKVMGQKLMVAILSFRLTL